MQIIINAIEKDLYNKLLPDLRNHYYILQFTSSGWSHNLIFTIENYKLF